MNFLQKKIFKEVINFINQNDYQVVYLYLGGLFTLSNVVSWIISKCKQRAEVKRLKQEVEKLSSETQNLDLEHRAKRLDQLEKLRPLRRKYQNDIEKIADKMKEIINILEKPDDYDLLESKWLELQDLFFHNLLKSFYEYMEIYEVFYEDSRKKLLNFIDDEIFRLFDLLKELLIKFNNEKILNKINQEKATLSFQTISAMIRFIENHISWYHWKRKRKMREFLKEIDLYEEYKEA